MARTLKCLIVEGKSDKLQVKSVLEEEVVILCTNGTMDSEALEDLIEPYENCKMYTLFDADSSGDYLRKVMKRIYPEARQLQTFRRYREVATTPRSELAKLLLAEHFKINTNYILPSKEATQTPLE